MKTFQRYIYKYILLRTVGFENNNAPIHDFNVLILNSFNTKVNGLHMTF